LIRQQKNFEFGKIDFICLLFRSRVLFVLKKFLCSLFHRFDAQFNKQNEQKGKLTKMSERFFIKIYGKIYLFAFFFQNVIRSKLSSNHAAVCRIVFQSKMCQLQNSIFTDGLGTWDFF
jgi:hypothetical protein